MLGTDIIEIERVRRSAENEAFYNGVFTESEREYYSAHGKRAETLAGMFCAKEAIVKALGSGFNGIKPCDIEITHDELGAPRVRFSNRIAALVERVEAEVSISHCKEYATAVAVCKRINEIKQL